MFLCGESTFGCVVIAALLCLLLLRLLTPSSALPLFQEITLTGSFRYVNCYPIAIDLVASGKIDVAKIVTHRVREALSKVEGSDADSCPPQYTFQDAMKAFEATLTGKGDDGRGTIKVQICQGQA